MTSPRDHFQFLLQLEDSTRPLESADEITFAAARLLGVYLDVNRCAYADVEMDEDTFNLTGNYNNGVETIVGRYRFADFGEECLRLMRENLPYVVSDSETDERAAEVRTSYRLTKIRAVICVPLHKSGRFVAAMAVHQAVPRDWLSDEVNLLQIVASRCWESIERSRVTRELRDNEARLREMDQRKDEFLAMLAHELRNPLAPIRNAAQLIEVKAPTDPEIRMSGEIIARQADHLTRLVDDLLDVSRVTRGMVTLDKRPIAIADVISSAVEQVKGLMDTKRQRFTLDGATTAGRVDGDMTRLVQVVANLLTNAAKYTPEHGSIALALHRRGGSFELVVSDTGMGIDKALLPSIFDLFTQAERSPDRSQGGLGLGLALAKRLVELHGGSVTALSAGQGQGSAFKVTLPACDAAAESPAVVHNAKDESPAQRVLIVDDNADAASSLAHLLEKIGHEVAVEHGGEQALERALLESPDVILLDIGMPGMDGFEVARRLRAAEATAHALLIAVTGYGQPEDRRRSKEAGFDYHLVKPVDYIQVQTLLVSGRSGM